jgi:hypothetical protein
MRIRVYRFTAALVLCVCAAASLLAQQTPPPPVDQFVPMSSLAPREVLPATPLVFYAYAFVWLVLIVYVYSIWRRMARVERDLADVQRRLKDGRGTR